MQFDLKPDEFTFQWAGTSNSGSCLGAAVWDKDRRKWRATITAQSDPLVKF